ncbi:DDB1- and CUL4-associated factor 5 [Onthophagus taurus]|uniref:DDB1- and CUL4-associated factor 5 n=1 Tax=Onthophagus taurus TaxID=166361 RepID=UPI000C1FE2E2|nr:DDB1- and CUL4-associated factor 5 [Onthophagus taurus]
MPVFRVERSYLKKFSTTTCASFPLFPRCQRPCRVPAVLIMASSSDINPINYIIKQQYNDSARIREKLFKERLRNAKNLYRKDLLAHYGCVNAIEFSEEGNLLVSGGDDRRVLLWFVPDAIYDKGAPVVMQTNHTSNIFCLAFDRFNTKIFSGGNDDQVIVHDIKTGQLVMKLPHRNPVYGLSVNPQDDNVLATAGDDGRVLIYDIREHEPEPIILAKESSGFHSVVFHPLNPRLLVTSNADEGIALWDCRITKKELLIYDRNAGRVSGISACFNSSGSRILALRRRLPPVLYETHNPNALCQFYHPQYYNSCTMKTCCFAGSDDEYVLSGSDDFSLYMWRVPDTQNTLVEWGEPHVVLQGHRSIVNQVRYNKHNNFIASSGVEKMVKLWSAVPVGTWNGSLLKEHQDPQRNVYSKDDYVYIVGHNSTRISHDYSDQSTQEDLRMMAFFDSLIQTEIQAWNSLSEDTYSSDSDSDKQSQEMIRNSWQSLLKCKRNAEELLKKHKPNKIAQLISQKKHKLAKMAHRRSSSLVLRYPSSDSKYRRKLNKFKNCPGSSCKFKKNNGLSLKKRTSCRNASKCLPPPPPPVTTSLKSTKHNKKLTENQVVERKYRTRSQTNRENHQNPSPSSSLDVPSTSTGITETTHHSSVVFRVIDQDSDEESTLNGCTETNDNIENNLVDVIPTPLNGSRGRIYINMVQVTNGGSATNPSNGNIEQHASTSTLQQDCDDGINNNNNTSVNKDNYESDSSMSDSDRNHRCTTSVRRKRKFHQNDVVSINNNASSSGRTKRTLRSNTMASSSNINYNENSSEDECRKQDKFKKRIKKSRVNYRKQIGGDSDSN